MKGSKIHERLSARSSLRRVSLRFSDSQVTAKVRTPIPMIPKPVLKVSVR